MFHFHKWKIYAVQDILRNVDNRPIGARYTLQCEKCGKLKIQTLL